jgi:hypothetical protein
MKFYEGSIGDQMARLKGGRLHLSDVLRYGGCLYRICKIDVVNIHRLKLLAYSLPHRQLYHL